MTTWALANQQVRALVLTGSRADPNASRDLFSDYDVELLVNNRDFFLINENALTVFGEALSSYREDHEDFSMRLILFKDYVRIDFKIYELAYLKKYTDRDELPEHWDIGYKIIEDKDEALSGFINPSFTAFLINKPNENEFIAVVNEFWWDATYVAKSLWRNEIHYAKYMLDHVIRFSYLQKLIEWHIGLAHHWRVSTNKHGRFFKKYLDHETWQQLEATFAGSGIEENWNALFATTRLFGQLARNMAKELNYFYPQKTEDEISAYLQKIRKLDQGATDIK